MASHLPQDRPLLRNQDAPKRAVPERANQPESQGIDQNSSKSSRRKARRRQSRRNRPALSRDEYQRPGVETSGPESHSKPDTENHEDDDESVGNFQHHIDVVKSIASKESVPALGKRDWESLTGVEMFGSVTKRRKRGNDGSDHRDQVLAGGIEKKAKTTFSGTPDKDNALERLQSRFSALEDKFNRDRQRHDASDAEIAELRATNDRLRSDIETLSVSNEHLKNAIEPLNSSVTALTLTNSSLDKLRSEFDKHKKDEEDRERVRYADLEERLGKLEASSSVTPDDLDTLKREVRTISTSTKAEISDFSKSNEAKLAELEALIKDKVEELRKDSQETSTSSAKQFNELRERVNNNGEKLKTHSADLETQKQVLPNVKAAIKTEIRGEIKAMLDEKFQSQRLKLEDQVKKQVQKFRPAWTDHHLDEQKIRIDSLERDIIQVKNQPVNVPVQSGSEKPDEARTAKLEARMDKVEEAISTRMAVLGSENVKAAMKDEITAEINSELERLIQKNFQPLKVEISEVNNKLKQQESKVYQLQIDLISRGLLQVSSNIFPTMPANNPPPTPVITLASNTRRPSSPNAPLQPGSDPLERAPTANSPQPGDTNAHSYAPPNTVSLPGPPPIGLPKTLHNTTFNQPMQPGPFPPWPQQRLRTLHLVHQNPPFTPIPHTGPQTQNPIAAADPAPPIAPPNGPKKRNPRSGEYVPPPTNARRGFSAAGP